MDVLQKVLLVLHLLGMAAIVGGWLAGRGRGGFPAVVVWGARAQLVTGILMVGLAEASHGGIDNAKIGVKLVVAIAVAAFAEIGRARAGRKERSATQLDVAGGGGVLNVLVAALW